MDKFTRFDNISSLVAAAARMPYSNSRAEWTGGPIDNAVAVINNGLPANSRQMKAASDLIEKVDATLHGRKKDTWEPNVAGAFPVVGEYLMGLPLHMRDRRKVENNLAPVTVAVEVSVSDGVDEYALAQRGAAICALVMKLNEVRPTELHIFGTIKVSGFDVTTWIARVHSQPISLAHAVGYMTTKEMARMINFSACCDMLGDPKSTCTGSIGWGHGYPGKPRETVLRRVLGLNPHDIIIQGGYLPDQEMMRSNPVAWIHKQLDAQREIEE